MKEAKCLFTFYFVFPFSDLVKEVEKDVDNAEEFPNAENSPVKYKSSQQTSKTQESPSAVSIRNLNGMIGEFLGVARSEAT